MVSYLLITSISFIVIGVVVKLASDNNTVFGILIFLGIVFLLIFIGESIYATPEAKEAAQAGIQKIKNA